MLKKDNLKLGLLLGFLGPLLSMPLYYYLKFYPLYTWKDLGHFVQENPNQVTAISVPCLILNIAIFTYYINTQRDRTAKGIFAVTIAYAVGSIVVKMLL